MDVSFITKRFFYSFLSGCIIIFYGIIYYYTLQYTSESFSFLSIILKFIRINPVFIFIIFAVFISIIVEGICQVGLERYLPLNDKKNQFNGKTLKDFNTCKEKHEYLRYKTLKSFLEFIFLKPSIFWVCECIKENDFNPLADFIKDSGLTEEKRFFNCGIKYNAVYVCAAVLDRDKKINDIYHYRDNSYIIQMLRLAFFCITVITVVSGIVFGILGNVNIWKFIDHKNCCIFLIFNFIASLISFIFFCCLSEISRSFAQRFVREVGYSYEAMKFKLPITQNDVHSL
jgi:hypothetical protein